MRGSILLRLGAVAGSLLALGAATVGCGGGGGGSTTAAAEPGPVSGDPSTVGDGSAGSGEASTVDDGSGGTSTGGGTTGDGASSPSPSPSGGAPRLVVGEPVEGALREAGAYGWYVVELCACEPYRLWTSGLDEGMDTVLELWSPDLTLLGRSDDASGAGLASSMSLQVSASGDHYVKVWHAAGRTGTYRLTLDAIPSLPEGVAPVASLAVTPRGRPERVVAVDEPLALDAAVVALEADVVSYRWRRGVATLQSGTIATPGSDAVAVPRCDIPAGSLPAGTSDVVVEVDDGLRTAQATVVVEVSDQAITLGALGLDAAASSLAAPLVRVVAPAPGTAVGRALSAEVAYAVFEAAPASFTFLGQEFRGLNRGSAGEVEVYLDATRVWQGNLPSDLKRGHDLAGPLDLTGFASGRHVLTVVGYEDRAADGVGRVDRVGVTLE